MWILTVGCRQCSPFASSNCHMEQAQAMEIKLVGVQEAHEAASAKLENLQGELDSKTLLLDGTEIVLILASLNIT